MEWKGLSISNELIIMQDSLMSFDRRDKDWLGQCDKNKKKGLRSRSSGNRWEVG
jgi:hypothetical protein